MDPRDRLRLHALDGALLLFQPSSGFSVKVETAATESLRRAAPRVVLFSLSHACNLSCGFCSRDAELKERWSEDAAFETLRALWRAGTLEVSFGGGEPLVHPGFVSLIERLHRDTTLALHFTTNGTRVTAALAERLASRVAEIRVSAYVDVDWEGPLRTLVEAGCRVGINVLVDPQRLGTLPGLAARAAALGACDLAVLRYVGEDRSRALDAADFAMLEQALLAAPLPVRVSNCLLDAMPNVPRLFPGVTVADSDRLRQDCGAGRDFVVIDPDAGVRSCSFHADAVTLETTEAWLKRYRRPGGLAPSLRSGCARPVALDRPTRRGAFVYRSFASNNSGDTLLVARFATVSDADAFLATLPEGLEYEEWRTFFRDAKIEGPSGWAGDAPSGLHVHGRTLLASGVDADDALPGLRQLLWPAGATTLYTAIHTHDNPALVLAAHDPERRLDHVLDERGLESSRRGAMLISHGETEDWMESLAQVGDALKSTTWTAELVSHDAHARWPDVLKHLDDETSSSRGYLYIQGRDAEAAGRLVEALDGEVSRAGDTVLCQVTRFRPRLGEFVTKQGGLAWWIPQMPLRLRYWSHHTKRALLDLAPLQRAAGPEVKVSTHCHGVDAVAETATPHRVMAAMQRLHEAIDAQVNNLRGGVWVGPQQPLLAAARRVKHELKILRG